MFYPTEYDYKKYFDEIAKKEEKNRIRKDANLLGVAFIIMSAIMVLWSIPISYIAELGIVDAEKIYKFLSDSTVVQGLQILLSSIAFLFTYWLYTKMTKTDVRDVCAFKKPKNKKLVFPFILLGLGVCGISNFLTSMAGTIFQSLGFDYERVVNENPTNPFGIVLTFVAISVTPALVEEFAMRGVVFGVLRRYGNGFAILVSAIVFGLMHGNLSQIPFAFVLGLYFGYIVVKTESVWPAVIIHFLNNFLSVATSYLIKDLSDTVVGIVNISYMLFLMVVGVIGFLILNKKGEKDFSFDEKETKLTTGQKLKAALTAPWMIVSYVIVLLESFFVYATV